MARQKYRPPVTPESPAECAHCDWKGTRDGLKEHWSTWDGAKPKRPECPGILYYIDPDPARWSRIDRYTVLVRQNQLAGMTTRKANREAAVEVGYRQPPEPMADDVRVMLTKRNEREREIKQGIKRRTEALAEERSKSGRRRTRT